MSYPVSSRKAEVLASSGTRQRKLRDRTLGVEVSPPGPPCSPRSTSSPEGTLSRLHPSRAVAKDGTKLRWLRLPDLLLPVDNLGHGCFAIGVGDGGRGRLHGGLKARVKEAIREVGVFLQISVPGQTSEAPVNAGTGVGC